ncbi:hypothetical protein [Methanosphaerula subterraneus]|uniref:hypothetical protein n=1 Tax=Methanosphaerula subterraneus TaxID=3350244 RepID=UPI003F858BBA
MSESAFSSSVRGAIPYASGLNGAVRREPEFQQNGIALPDAGGMAIRLRSGRLYIVRRPALAAAARGPSSSRFTPAARV